VSHATLKMFLISAVEISSLQYCMCCKSRNQIKPKK